MVIEYIYYIHKSTFSFVGSIVLQYTGRTAYLNLNWEIYFSSIRIFQQSVLKKNPHGQVALGHNNITVSHVDGTLHVLRPSTKFSGFQPNATVTLPFEASFFSVAKTDIFPNWYMVEEVAGERDVGVIPSTAGESLDFVADFVSAKQWKRRQSDQFSPYTPEVRSVQKKITKLL